MSLQAALGRGLARNDPALDINTIGDSLAAWSITWDYINHLLQEYL
jgi:hypothetical protein